MKITDNYVFFFKGSDWPSNFYLADFTYTKFRETHKFFCSEQAFMWVKAMTFSDTEVAQLILNATTTPDSCKKYGRMIKGYDDQYWSTIRQNVMKDVLLAKFDYGNKLHDVLLDEQFDNKLFVEASPYDKVWGVGLAEDNPDILDKKLWLGENLLGKTITKVRNHFKRGFTTR